MHHPRSLLPLSLALALAACNEAPSTPTISLTPENPTTIDSLVLEVTGDSVDPNAKDTVTYRTRWTMDGSGVDSLADQYTVPAGQTAKGQVWTATVSATDGKELGQGAQASVTIANAPPIATVEITPANPATNATIRTSVTKRDYDQDPVTVAYQWSVNGSVHGNTNTELKPAATSKGQVWEVRVTPNDGEVDGEPAIQTFTIANTPPEATGARVLPVAPTKRDTLSCEGSGWFDLDDDEPGYQVEWKVNGVSVATSDTLAVADLNRGDKVRCVLTPFDGDDTGEPLTSTEVVVANTPPTLASAVLTPEDPTKLEVVTVILGAASDMDGDTVTFRYKWTVSGREVGTGEFLPASRFLKGDTIRVSVTPFDGISEGTPVVSDPVIGGNNPPTIDSLVLSHTTLYSDTLLKATTITSDPDGEDVDVIFDWYVDGTKVAATGPELDGVTWFDRGQKVSVTATADDGDDLGNSRTSPTLTVVNKVPTEPVLDLDPTDAAPGDEVVCDMTTVSVDADSDPISYTFRWTKDGTLYTGTSTTTYTGDTIPADVTGEDELWICTVTPNDGYADGPKGTVLLDFREGPFEFDNCSKTGNTGPTQSACNTSYSGTPLDGKVTVTSGVQVWTVPRTGKYSIEAWGAAGVSADSARKGGKGARMKGTFDLKGGDKLSILVGQMGVSDGCSGGGGGGTWVLDSTGKPLLVAGGGAGTRTSVSQNGCDGRTTEYGGTASGSGTTWSCGAKTSGLKSGGIVSSGSWGSAGGGLDSNGANDSSCRGGTCGGYAPKNGGNGGGGSSDTAYGGFGAGGGGNGSCGGGGGGGYSGGDGGRLAGGGGSFNDGTDQDNAAGVNDAAGAVEINRVGS